VLAALVLFDVVLTIWAGVVPQLWFDAFHGVTYDDPERLLRRTAAQWAAYALVQLVALVRCRREPWWLVVVAGVRLSDVFTDLVYVLSAPDLTWFAKVALPGMGPINLLLGWYLIRAWQRDAGGAITAR
jgi:hypothetical protein